MKIAFVSSEQLPKPDLDQQLLLECCNLKGLEAPIISWTQTFDWAAMDAAVLRTPWDYVHQPVVFLEWAYRTAQCTSLLNDVKVVAWNIHKRYMLELDKARVPIVPTVILPKCDKNALSALLAFGESEVVVKPAISIGAIGALRAHASSIEMQRHLLAAIDEGDVLLQPFIPSVQEEGEISLIYFGGVFSHAVKKRPKKGDYRVQDHHGGTVEDYVPTKEHFAVAQAALACSPSLPIYARIDLVEGRQGPYVMELELIEPELFLRCDDGASNRFIDAVVSSVRQQ